MFHHLNLFSSFALSLSLSPSQFTQKSRAQKKRKERKTSPTTIHTENELFVQLLFIPHKFNEKKRRWRRKKRQSGKSSQSFIFFCAVYVGIFCLGLRKISSLNKFYICLVSLLVSLLSIVICFYLNEKMTQKKKEKEKRSLFYNGARGKTSTFPFSLMLSSHTKHWQSLK